MITISDSYNTIDLERYYAILNPSQKNIKFIQIIKIPKKSHITVKIIQNI